MAPVTESRPYLYIFRSVEGEVQNWYVSKERRITDKNEKPRDDRLPSKPDSLELQGERYEMIEV